MPDTARELRALLDEHRAYATHAGYPQSVRSRVGAYVRQRRQAGVLWVTLSDELGVSTTALSNWMKIAPPTFLPVPHTPPTPPPAPRPALTLTSPNGWRVDGLTLEQIAALMGAMA